jgi:beta-barrel assembly-enhancing protease
MQPYSPLRISVWIDRAIASQRIAIACAVALIIIPITLVWVAIPKFAQWAAEHIPVAMEDKLGQYILDNYAQPNIFTSMLNKGDAEAALALHGDRFQQLARLAQLDNVTLHFTHGVPNAYALPGNHVVITYELLNLLTDEAELDAIIAHELGHLRHRDGMRVMLGNGLLTEFVLINNNGQDGGRVATVLSNVFVFSHYTRDAEAAADQFAVDLLAKNGQSPALLAYALEKLDKYQSKHTSNAAPRYTSSHPEIQERIHKALQAADDVKSKQP